MQRHLCVALRGHTSARAHKRMGTAYTLRACSNSMRTLILTRQKLSCLASTEGIHLKHEQQQTDILNKRAARNTTLSTWVPSRVIQQLEQKRDAISHKPTVRPTQTAQHPENAAITK